MYVKVLRTMSERKGMLCLRIFLWRSVKLMRRIGVRSHVFADDRAVLEEIARFSAVADEAWKLDGKLHDTNAKQQVVENHLAPAFEAWKVSVMQHLRPYIEQ